MNVFTAKKCNNCNYISESIKYLYKKIKRKICNAVFVFIIKYEAQADHLSYCYSLLIAPPIYSTPVTMETLSSVSVERMKVQLLQKQSELTTTIQAFEEFKEVNKYVHVTSM